MSTKLSSYSSKSSYNQQSKRSNSSAAKYGIPLKITPKPTPKTVIASKKIVSSSNIKGSFSGGDAIPKKGPVKPKKTTKSDIAFHKTCTVSHNTELLRCDKCGDIKKEKAVEETSQNNVNIDSNNTHQLDKPGKTNKPAQNTIRNSNNQTSNEPETTSKQNKKKINSILSKMNVKSVKNDNNIIEKGTSKQTVKQYFKNDNFYPSNDSIHEEEFKKSLDTIKEVSDIQNISTDSVFRILTEDDDDIINFDPDSEVSIKQIREFRQKNYFECHSSKSRIKSKPSVTSLDDHKCVYRFYLNSRLFPEPLNKDYNNKIRCVECHLPMDTTNNSVDKINGTIQAKVKLGPDDTQDMLLLLPVKETLIIEERRKEEKVNNEYVYFGVVKLKQDGSSAFNTSVNEDSLALRYQKGYREHYGDFSTYEYKKVDKCDVIVI